ncbi:MAG: lipoyl synthase, partial [Candidatus Omnitrophica bacterium]|nr:lipoyl synthase [Candidatus Omnitrophota bacterium]
MVERFPPWLRKRIVIDGKVGRTSEILKDLELHTVCEEAGCPNINECFSQSTATFMILGNLCTRNCRFCGVKKNKPLPVDNAEPARVAEAAERLGLRYVVITSVTRDDLVDGGAEQFRDTILAIRE